MARTVAGKFPIKKQGVAANIANNVVTFPAPYFDATAAHTVTSINEDTSLIYVTKNAAGVLDDGTHTYGPASPGSSEFVQLT